MAAAAANKAQPQGPQVPRVPQANVVQHILAERPPQKTNSRLKRALGNVSTVFPHFASAAVAFHVHVSACSHLSLLLHFAKYFVLALPPFTFICWFLSSWLTLFITLLSAFRADMYFISVFPA